VVVRSRRVLAMIEGKPCTRLVCQIVGQTARLMVGEPDHLTYVMHRQTRHPEQPVLESFRERQAVRYMVGKGRFRGCC